MATLFQNLPYGTIGNAVGAYYAPVTGGANVTSPQPLIAWGQGIGTALSTFGWIKDATPTGTVNWTTVTLGSTVRTDWNLFPSTTTLNHRGAWAQGVTYSVSDTVTDNGQTWVCNLGYTSTSTTGTSTSASPYNEWRTGGTNHWFVYPFEVWKSASTPTIYIRFDYLGWTTNGQGYLPLIRIKVGTSTDVNGTLGTGVGQTAMGPFNCGSGGAGFAATNNFSGGYPCYFSGDSTNRFAMLMWYPFDGFEGSQFFCIERSISSTGNYYTTPSGFTTPYWTAIWAGYNQQNSGAGQVIMQSLVNTTGTTWVKTGQEITATTLSCALDHSVNPNAMGFTTGQGAGNQSVPALPVYPLVGWVGNPMTAVLAGRFNASTPNTCDLPSNTGLFTQTIYGTSHTYLSLRASNIFSEFGSPNSTTGTTFFQGSLAMRYD